MRTGKIVRPSIFEPNDEFPEMSKNLALRDNETFGKHLIANYNIEKGARNNGLQTVCVNIHGIA